MGSAESRYEESLRELRFRVLDLCEMVASGSMHHAYYPRPGAQMAVGNPHKRLQRIASEMATLAKSLPVYCGSSIFLVPDSERMDVMKALITGPQGSPYANGIFEFDISLPPNYPQSPPQVLLTTTGGGSVRFNPNLYASGKVCLSLLGTWQGPGWEPATSTLPASSA